MKLYEIVAPAKYTKTTVDPNTSQTAYVDRALRGKGTKELGRGSFAHTFQHKDSPYPEVYRASRFLDANDPHAAYIDAIQQNEEIRNNPYAPRVYSIRHVSKPNLHPQEARLHRMEPLISLESLEFDELMGMFERMFPFFRVKDQDVILKKDVSYLAQVGAALIYNMVSGEISVDQITNDEKLKEIVLFLRSFKQNNKCLLDIGIENVMVRRTQYGPQLVFTDPFC